MRKANDTPHPRHPKFRRLTPYLRNAVRQFLTRYAREKPVPYGTMHDRNPSLGLSEPHPDSRVPGLNHHNLDTVYCTLYTTSDYSKRCSRDQSSHVVEAATDEHTMNPQNSRHSSHHTVSPRSSRQSPAPRAGPTTQVPAPRSLAPHTAAPASNGLEHRSGRGMTDVRYGAPRRTPHCPALKPANAEASLRGTFAVEQFVGAGLDQCWASR